MKSIRVKKFLDTSRTFDGIIQILILTSIIQLTLETLPSLGQKYHTTWQILEVFFVIVFSLEYILRLYFETERLKFIFSFYGLIDLLAILPSILSFGLVDLRILRIIRFLRIIRILKLARYSKALNRLKDAFHQVKEELIVFFCLSIVILYISAAGIYFFEHQAQPQVFQSIPHSLWWAVATLTTVGYGDIYPITIGGKIFTFIVLMIGVSIISIPSALLAGAFLKK